MTNQEKYDKIRELEATLKSHNEEHTSVVTKAKLEYEDIRKKISDEVQAKIKELGGNVIKLDEDLKAKGKAIEDEKIALEKELYGFATGDNISISDIVELVGNSISLASEIKFN